MNHTVQSLLCVSKRETSFATPVLHLPSQYSLNIRLLPTVFSLLFTALFVILVSDFVISILIFCPFYFILYPLTFTPLEKNFLMGFILLLFALRSSPYALRCLLPTTYSLLLALFHSRPSSLFPRPLPAP